MNTTQVEKERNKIGFTATNLYGSCFRRYQYVDHKEDALNLKDAEVYLSRLENYYNNISPEQLPVLMGGEFPHKYLGDIDNLMAMTSYSREGIPLFMFLDIAIKALEENYINYSSTSKENKEIAQSLSEKIKNFREKIITLPHNQLFDSNKHISESAWYGISKGDFSFSVEKKEGLEYINLNYTISYDDGVWKNGDYYSYGSSRSSNSNPCYEEDSIEINKRANERIQNEVAAFYAEFTKYFIDGKIPNYDNLRKNLIDKNLDEKIIKELETFCVMYAASNGEKNATLYALSDNGKIRLEALKRAERTVAVELEEKQKAEVAKTTALAEARARYQQKSFFWKLVHRKLNPEKINIEKLETEQINRLYNDEGKKRK